MPPTINTHPDMERLLAVKFSVNRDLDPESQRDGWDEYRRAFERPYPASMRVNDYAMPAIDDANPAVPIRVYRPDPAAEKSPFILYFHGGGFVKGDLNTSDTIAWGIAELSGAVVISVDYRLAPEHPFPAASDDAFNALCYLAEQAGRFDLDAQRIAVCGDSAGANIAAALCLMSRDRGGPAIKAQALNYPCLNDEFVAESYTRYAEGPGLTTADMTYYWEQYLGLHKPTDNGYAVPIKAQNHAGLPPAHIHIAEIDPLADDGRTYARLLEQAGVVSQLRVANGMVHGYLRARFDGTAAAAEFAAPCRFLHKHLFATG
ncbi:MAG: acetyl esterase [Planctomycetota bacterium]|jgi:acetyl esterase